MRKSGGRTSADIVASGKRQIVYLDILADDLNTIAEMAARALRGSSGASFGARGLNETDVTHVSCIVALARLTARRVRARARREVRKGVAK